MNKRILIAEDSSVILNLTKKILAQKEYEIDTAKNGEQVLAKFKSASYDLLLLDIFMPKIDGMECARIIRKENTDMPIIAITGNANNYTMDEFKEAGINDFLPKPLNYDEMIELVDKYIGHAG